MAAKFIRLLFNGHFPGKLQLAGCQCPISSFICCGREPVEQLGQVIYIFICPHLAKFPEPIQAHNPNITLISSAVFAQVTAECPYTLQQNAPPPLKIAPAHGGSGHPSNASLLGTTRVLSPNVPSWEGTFVPLGEYD